MIEKYIFHHFYKSKKTKNSINDHLVPRAHKHSQRRVRRRRLMMQRTIIIIIHSTADMQHLYIKQDDSTLFDVISSISKRSLWLFQENNKSKTNSRLLQLAEVIGNLELVFSHRILKVSTSTFNLENEIYIYKKKESLNIR